jgi:hypothetical protein
MVNARIRWIISSENGEIAQLDPLELGDVPGIWIGRKVFQWSPAALVSVMSRLDSPEHVCSFCMLVIQIGYDELSDNDVAKVSAHMRIAHRLKPYEIPA